MTRRLIACWLAACAVAIGPAGGALAQAPAQPAPRAVADKAGAGIHRTPPDYVIGPLDVLQILFWRDKELTSEVVVRPDGKITLPLLNEFEASGQTPEQLRLEILDRARRFIEDPTANVVVKQINSRKVFILGEVTKPGTYPLEGQTTVLQLIATAGGLTAFAVKDDIVVLRTLAEGQTRFRVNYNAVVKGSDPKQNIELKPGDTVVVP